jgi:predicted  nucleic acid-binding Zn-ribbon protein
MDMASQISLEVLIGIGSGIVGSVGAYIRLKSRIDRLEMENLTQEKEITDLRERKKEMNSELHNRIDLLKTDMSTLKTDMTQGHSSLETMMAKMELRIVQEIQKITK